MAETAYTIQLDLTVGAHVSLPSRTLGEIGVQVEEIHVRAVDGYTVAQIDSMSAREFLDSLLVPHEDILAEQFREEF